MKRFALISVFDKTGIVEFAKSINELGYKIISTGGTAKVLKQNKIPLVPIQDITGNPESFDGRMKTISFQVESGILYDRKNKSHIKQAIDLKIPQIDIVVCNLYPFEQTVAKKNVSRDEMIENIDVGGPTMIRAAAKNFKNVLVVVNPSDYEKISKFLTRHSGEQRDSRIRSWTSQDDNKARMTFRKKLAAKAFAHLSFYDSQIARYLNNELFPAELTIPGRKTFILRYGENPHQQAAVYTIPNTHSPFENIQKQWGRDLSYINVTDINAGIDSVALFDSPCAVVIKHNTPCGIALGKTAYEALSRAIEADPESAFGGIIVMNVPMNLEAAKIIGEFKDEKKSNIDIVAVSKIDIDALEYLKSVRKSMGIYTFNNVILSEAKGSKRNSSSRQILPQNDICRLNIKFINGGFIAQISDKDIEKSFLDWKTITRKKPTQSQLKQMMVAWKFISRIRSNAVIVVDKDIPMTRGIGTGQTSRIRSTKIALEQADKHTKGAILASDSFFPFDDSVKLATKAGITAIVQQGGSMNDQASIDAADKSVIVMVFTGRRAFWH